MLNVSIYESQYDLFTSDMRLIDNDYLSTKFHIDFELLDYFTAAMHFNKTTS